MVKQNLINALKRLQINLGRVPKRDEFCAAVKNARQLIDREFGTYSKFLSAAGVLDISGKIEIVNQEKQQLLLEKRYKALCSKKEQIQGFFRHVIDLDDLFERAGNPEVLKVSVQPDTHVKFKDDKAVGCYLNFLEHYKPDVHLILGDFIDAEGLSHWPAKDLEPRRIVPEMKQARQLLQQIVDKTPECSTRIFLEGNHENWIEQALTKMPEMFDGLAELDIEISIKTLLGLNKFGYELYPLNHLIKIGKAHFTHGIYTGNNHAAKHMNEFKANIYYGHLHDTASCNNVTMDGPIEAASLGCLCRLDAAFLKGKKNNWCHSHGTFEFLRDGTYFWNLHRIFNGVSSFNGKIISA